MIRSWGYRVGKCARHAGLLISPNNPTKTRINERPVDALVREAFDYSLIQAIFPFTRSAAVKSVQMQCQTQFNRPPRLGVFLLLFSFQLGQHIKRIRLFHIGLAKILINN